MAHIEEFEDPMPIEDVYAMMDAAHAEIEKEQAIEKLSNDRLIKVLKKRNGTGWVKGLMLLCSDCDVHGRMEIVRNHPRKEYWQEENFGPIKEMWVLQYSVGDSGDSFAGTIWLKIDKKRFLQLMFSC